MFKREKQEREPRLLLPLWPRKIRPQVLLTALKHSHKADAVVLRDCTDPAFLMDITPTRKRQHGPGLAISLCREKKKLHALLSYPDLGDALRLVVVKNTAADCLKIGELVWNVVMFQPVFHKEQIA